MCIMTACYVLGLAISWDNSGYIAVEWFLRPGFFFDICIEGDRQKFEVLFDNSSS